MKRFTAVTLVSLTFSVSATACLWDRDTLNQERRRFPTILELITGNFLRHSPEFYQWRIENRKLQLKNSAENPALYDDLAVAHEKLGHHQVAIDLMLQKDELHPGLYETYANLGTFYIHAGNYQEGLKQIRKAISINPDAHFGREIYQARLIEYLLSRTKNEPTLENDFQLPLFESSTSTIQPRGFASYLVELIRNEEPGPTEVARKPESKTDELENINPNSLREDNVQQELADALKGVAGMMRFGNFSSPILLEALGDLLLAQGILTDGKQLAARAYLKASYETEGATSFKYRRIAEAAIDLQVTPGNGNQQLTLDELERQFKAELQQGNNWYRVVSQSEKEWIDNGVNPEKEFMKTYPVDPQIQTPPIPISRNQTVWRVGIFLICSIGFFLTWKKIKCCRQATVSPS